MIKRSFWSFLLCATLTLCLCAPAFADSAVVETLTLEARDIIFNKSTNTMGVLLPDASQYVLMNAAGEKLTTAPYIGMRCKSDMFEVAVSEGTNNLGLIDGQGNEVMPMQYGDIEYISPRWQLGVVLADATVDNYDYKSFSGDAFYLISGLDVYFDGAKVGTLARTEYSSAYAYGAYLYVRDKEGAYTFYDKTFTKSAYVSDGSSEYEENYKDHSVWHKGSNQQAFTAGCTLTPDDVEQSIWHLNGQFFDLQGNLLFKAASPYDYVRKYEGDYASVKAYGKYGLIDREGNEVVPCEYDEIITSESYLASGYQAVVKDGKIGFVNAKGQVTCGFTYGSANARAYSPFATLKDMDGNVLVLSGAIGELPERYKEVSLNYGDTCPVFAAQNLSEQAGVIDLAGNAVIPFDGAYDSAYDLEISNDGTVVLGYNGSRQYTIYQLAHTEVTAPAPAAAEADGWTCSCGVTNTGKFCTECGSAKPEPEVAAQDGGWTCACGAANTGKFCPECGSAKPEASAKAVCQNCGFEPAEGESLKFCPECGTAF